MVLKNDGQNAQCEDNGKTFQAGGDISLTEVHNHNGMSQSDVIHLVNELVSSKVSQYAAEAKLEFEKRISSFTNDFYLKMLGQQTDNLLNRFCEPSIQTSYRTAAIQYGMNKDEHKKDILIDLLLDRFSSQDISKDSIALDQAISNIGQVTNTQIDFLTFWASIIFLLPLSMLNTFDKINFYIEELSSLIIKNDENMFHTKSFLISAGFIQKEDRATAQNDIAVVKSIYTEYYEKILCDAGIEWNINPINNVKEKEESDTEKKLFPNFTAACAKFRQYNASATCITPSGLMLARKNLSLKIPQFPKIDGVFYG